MKEEKKTPKQLDPWCKVFVTIDYHYMHVYKTSEENTAPVSQATMYKKINNTSITFPLMISILDLKSNDINKDFDLTLSFTKNSLTKKI